MLKPLRVLAVDDDADMLDVISTFLEARRHTVHTRRSAREGLDALRETEYDLLISDVRMANMNGFEFVRRARDNHPEIGIVLMTAYTDDYPLSEALAAGADGYITKPFSLTKFSLIFESAYWKALSRQDWWEQHEDGPEASGQVGRE